ncbi:unnamed protein product [Mytilus edulis]|uniref:Uncharacterized protein n=1 Tax=Mytilus edulis TaxID=6550 RepID=A0A8S3T4W8_MYTED|nr:unnamed protein product [Mytilus edulis]
MKLNWINHQNELQEVLFGREDIDSILDIFHDYKGPLGVEHSYNAISEIVNTGKECKSVHKLLRKIEDRKEYKTQSVEQNARRISKGGRSGPFIQLSKSFKKRIKTRKKTWKGPYKGVATSSSNGNKIATKYNIKKLKKFISRESISSENLPERLANLLRLNLNSNKLGKNNMTLSKNCFKYLPKLRHLSLKGNTFTKFPDISSIRSLQILNATFINGMTFYQQSSSLENLAYLDLSGPSSCKPKSLNKHTFSALPSLLYLDVSNIDLGSIMKETFSQMKYLQYLDISYNTRLGFVGVENVTQDLPNTSIRVFKFQKIVPTFSMNQMLMKDQMKPLNGTKIREIYADSNRIQLVEIGAISYLPNTIEKISIGENWLSYGPYIFELQKLSTKRSPNIKTLKLQNNLLGFILPKDKGDFEFVST